ncbi:unnamed protein product, partial [Mesorhabditis belari]|uniref:Uncharacterized protein n=1 Tax=Mesorhabditis belari TaxID=2138241 RepID=A0AAF3EYY2_9BILA
MIRAFMGCQKKKNKYLQIEISKLLKQLGSELMTAIKEGLKSRQAACGLYGRPVAQPAPVCSIYNARINLTRNPSEAIF